MSQPGACLLCRKRRVRCDFQQPSCKRCQSDNKPCPGYKAPLRIQQYCPRSSKTRKSIKREEDTLELAVRIPSRICLQEEEKISLNWLEVARYYNSYVVQELSAEPVILCTKLSPDIGLSGPPTTRTFLVLMIRSIQAARDHLDGPAKVDFYHHRELCISSIRQSLLNGGDDPYGIALAGTMLLMMGDIQMHCLDAWRVHQQAAQTLIDSQGGFNKALSAFPYNLGLFINFLVIDVFHTTTCGKHALVNQRIDSHLEYLEFLQSIEKDPISNQSGIPRTILISIIQVNLLRMQQCSRSEQKLEVLSQLEAFNSSDWAQKVLEINGACPLQSKACQKSEVVDLWTSLAQAYQSSTILYLVLSTSCPYQRNRVLEEISVLGLALDKLFQHSRGEIDKPNERQLWKFSCWPMFVSVYARLAWFPDQELPADHIAYLERTRYSLTSPLLIDIPEVICNIREKARLHENWQWEDGFAD